MVITREKKIRRKEEWLERKSGVYGAIYSQVQYMLALIASWSAEKFIKMHEILVLPTLSVACRQQGRFLAQAHGAAISAVLGDTRLG